MPKVIVEVAERLISIVEKLANEIFLPCMAVGGHSHKINAVTRDVFLVTHSDIPPCFYVCAFDTGEMQRTGTPVCLA